MKVVIALLFLVFLSGPAFAQAGGYDGVMAPPPSEKAPLAAAKTGGYDGVMAGPEGGAGKNETLPKDIYGNVVGNTSTGTDKKTAAEKVRILDREKIRKANAEMFKKAREKREKRRAAKVRADAKKAAGQR